MEILTVRDLNFKYALGKEDAIHGVSFGVEEGDFVAISGPTGCGKSTLLRMLKRELTPLGEKSGTVLYRGTPLEDIDDRTAACSIGFVMQRPEQQIVTDKVWHELAFGLENMGVPQEVIRRRVSEMASYFGIEDWFETNVADLSGGQKQLLNLAAIMVMQPGILILDEPTSQLDPIAASDFLATVAKLNTDMGLTVIIVEHRLQEVVPEASKLMIMDKGGLLLYGEPKKVCAELPSRPDLLAAMPSTVRLFSSVSSKMPELHEGAAECPLTVGEGRRWLESFGNSVQPEFKDAPELTSPYALEIKDIWFRYGRNLHDVLRGTDLNVHEGEILCVLGGNGSGKSTCLGAVSGLLKPYSGSIRIFGKDIKEYKNQSLYRNCLTMLPQDVQTLFLKNTVREELADAGASAALLPYDMESLLDKHPYDLSGGEQQMVALAKVLATEPRLLLLDEPTKGIDAHSSERIIDVLKSLRDGGMTIVIVTHDVEFASKAADRCAMFFRGEVTSTGTPREFFSENNFYTTSVNRRTRGYYAGCVTLEDAEQAIELQRR